MRTTAESAACVLFLLLSGSLPRRMRRKPHPRRRPRRTFHKQQTTTRFPSSSPCRLRTSKPASANLHEGHLETAKTEFNRSLEVLLESPYGGRTEPRIREHFDRLVERISAYEVTALAQGDGFAEKKYEPATIDELLAISTFEQPPATHETKQTVSEDLQETVHDIDIPLQREGVSYVELFSGRLKGYLEDGLSRGARYLPMIQDVFRAEGLPLDLAYVPLIESAFKPSALSRAKAKGIWQFMQRHRARERAGARLVHRRARRSGKGDARGGEVPEDAARDVRRLAPGARVVQRRPRPRAARDEAFGPGRLLGADGADAVPAARNPRLRAADPGGHHRRAESGAVRAERRAAPDIPDFETVTLPRPIDLRRVAEWAGVPVERHPGPEPRAAPLDDARAGDRLRAEGAGGHGGRTCSRRWRRRARGLVVAESLHRQEGRDDGVDRARS